MGSQVAAISENYVGPLFISNRATYEFLYGTSPQDNITFVFPLLDFQL